jgi:N-acetylglucosaminyldiphosphoundecaprenol N-acetyl-beta-D-mannosaminyltransferase
MARIKIIETWIDKLDMAELLTEIERLVASGVPRQVITANVDHLVTTRKSMEIGKMFQDAALVVADGVPLLWAARFLKTPLSERINGTDLMEQLCKLAAQRGFSVFLLGSPEEIANDAARNMQRRYPGLKLSGILSPHPGFENDVAENQKIISQLKESRADILFTSLGFPKGVCWISRHLPAFGIPVVIEVGASFVFIAGKIRRAPRWMQRAGMEWFWRLIHEPRRLWKRYLINDLPFFYYLIRQRLSAAKPRRPDPGAPGNS